MPLTNDDRMTAGTRAIEGRAISPAARGVLYADARPDGGLATGAVKPPPPKPPSGSALVLAGGDIASVGTITIKITNGRGREDRVVASINVPDIRRVSGYNDAAIALLRKKGYVGATGQVKVVPVDSKDSVRRALAEAKGRFETVVWFGHDQLEADPTRPGLLRSTGITISRSRGEIMDRSEFLRLVTTMGASPSVAGCYGSEGPGIARGERSMFGIKATFNPTPAATKRLKSKGSGLSTGEVTFKALEEEEMDDTQRFILEELRIPH